MRLSSGTPSEEVVISHSVWSSESEDLTPGLREDTCHIALDTIVNPECGDSDSDPDSDSLSVLDSSSDDDSTVITDSSWVRLMSDSELLMLVSDVSCSDIVVYESSDSDLRLIW